MNEIKQWLGDITIVIKNMKRKPRKMYIINQEKRIEFNFFLCLPCITKKILVCCLRCCKLSSFIWYVYSFTSQVLVQWLVLGRYFERSNFNLSDIEQKIPSRFCLFSFRLIDTDTPVKGLLIYLLALFHCW